MPALGNIAIYDGAATPVLHTFKPRATVLGISTFVESTGVPIGERRITTSQSRPASGRVKATLKLAIPIVVTETIDGVARPRVDRVSYADITFNFDKASTTQERDDLVAFVSNLTLSSNATMMSFLVDLEDMY